MGKSKKGVESDDALLDQVIAQNEKQQKKEAHVKKHPKAALSPERKPDAPAKPASPTKKEEAAKPVDPVAPAAPSSPSNTFVSKKKAAPITSMLQDETISGILLYIGAFVLCYFTVSESAQSKMLWLGGVALLCMIVYKVWLRKNRRPVTAGEESSGANDDEDQQQMDEAPLQVSEAEMRAVQFEQLEFAVEKEIKNVYAKMSGIRDTVEKPCDEETKKKCFRECVGCDELLTRMMFTVDGIDIAGDDTLRAKRKECIRSINKVITDLENLGKETRLFLKKKKEDVEAEEKK